MTTPSQRIAFVCPRFAEGATVGGAETLLKNLAARAAGAGRRITFLTTCAQDHFTWKNDLPAGTRRIGNMDVMFFPVDADRDLESFVRIQTAICRRAPVTEDEEKTWLENSVNSRALCAYIKDHTADFDRIVLGPYLFGLVYHAALICPEKTVLVPCLHDEPFAYLAAIRSLFRRVRRIMFNTGPERDLGLRLYDLPPERCSVVGTGIDDFEADPAAFAARHGIGAPYVIYSGRREPLKGTPLLLDYMAAFLERTELDVSLVLTGAGEVEIPPDVRSHVLDFGFVAEQEKHEAMAGAVAFCHPSVNESLSIVLLESWIARTPAIVHAGSAVMRDQCGKSNGGLWFRTYPEFEEELLLCLKDPEIRRRMGHMGRQYVLREYAWPAIDERLFSALDAAG
jgi:glycosyltransferase involved in cell wall biosynthesis